MVNIEEKSPHVSRKREGKESITLLYKCCPQEKLSYQNLTSGFYQSLPYLQEGKYPTTALFSHLAQPDGGK
jgi:hypothetical protein